MTNKTKVLAKTLANLMILNGITTQKTEVRFKMEADVLDAMLEALADE